MRELDGLSLRDNRMRRALIIRHHVEDDAGLVGTALVERGFTLETIMLDHEHRGSIRIDVDAIVVLGSNNAVYDVEVRTTWLDEELLALRRAHDAGVAIFGICFGAQALCVMFDGAVERATNVEEGWFTIDVIAGCEISRGPWFEYHGDHCLVPSSARVLARTSDAVQVFAIGRHLAVQFHPEVDADQLARWFASETPTARAHSARQTQLLEQTRRESARATVDTAALVDFFLKNADLDL